VGDIDFKVISAANSNKFQKTRFWKAKSVEDMVKLGPRAQATLVYIKKCLKAKIKFWKLKQIDLLPTGQYPLSYNTL
jgi:hypothetical protein